MKPGGNPYTAAQAERFSTVVAAVRASGGAPAMVHAANSAAAMDHPALRGDLARCGIAVYGLDPSPALVTAADTALKPETWTSARGTSSTGSVTVASATGVARTHARLSGTEPLEAREVAELARTGDAAAGQAFALAVAALVEALTAYATLLGPETVVVGGGLAGAFDLLGPPVAAGLESRLTFQRRPQLVSARLGADAGVIGAGLVAWDLIREDGGP